RARRQLAAALPTHAAGAQPAGAEQGEPQRGDGVFEGVAATLPPETAVAARVRHGRTRHAGRAIAGRGDEVLLHDEAHVFLAHPEVDNACSALALDLQDYLDGIFLLHAGDVRDRLALPLGPRRVGRDA